MNMLKAALLALVAASASFAAAEADAHGRRHHHHRSHVGIWFGVPAPVFYPRPYYYPRYYYPPAVVVPAPAPPVYIERPAASAPAPTTGSAAYWYYCRDSETYYPYVQQCASPWEQVVPNSAPPS